MLTLAFGAAGSGMVLISLIGGDHAVSAAILTRFWAGTPCPLQIRALSRPSRGCGPRYGRLRYGRLRVAMRASLPVRHLAERRNAAPVFADLADLAGSAFPWLTTQRTPTSCRAFRRRLRCSPRSA